MSRFPLFPLALLVVATAGVASETPKCPDDPSAVSLHAMNIDVRSALRALARQTQLNIAVDTRLRASFPLKLECVPARTALVKIVTLAGAGYCDEGKVIRVFAPGRQEPCAGTVFRPAGVQQIDQRK